MIEQLFGDGDTLLNSVLAVALATIAICGVTIFLLRLFGVRSLATASIADIACVIALGAVVGRTTLLAVPTLATGVTALVVLFTMQRGLAVLGRRNRWRRLLGSRPVVLMLDGAIDERALRRCGVSTDMLRQRLRLAGVGCVGQVHLVILESSGAISVLRRPDNSTSAATSERVADDWLFQDLDWDGP